MNARHLVIGAGGSRAFLTGLGAVVAMRLGGLRDWTTVGGVSGGSIPALFMAAHLDSFELLERLQDLDFSKLMRSSANGHDAMSEYAADADGNLPQPRGFFTRLLRRSALHTDLLGEAIEEVVKSWPENFWTMAMTESSHVLFTQVGVYEYNFDGTVSMLSREPAPVGLAIRATCAIPGLLEPVHYRGRLLFDGSLGPFGGCPVAWVRKHFMAEAQTIVSCASTGKGPGRDKFLVALGRRLLCRDSFKVQVGDFGAADINIESSMPDLNTFRFRLSPDQRRNGLLAGYNSAVAELARHKETFGGLLKDLANCLDFKDLLGLTTSDNK